MSSDLLYEWPAAARFGRPIPKTRFYERTRIAGRVRDHFVSDVQRITWAYKLADATIHLRGTDAVPEIQIFVVEVKGEDVADDVLTTIDKSIPFPIIFEISRPDHDPAGTRMVAAPKKLGGSSPRVGRYFTTVWLPADALRSPMPAALDLAGLYAGLLEPLLPSPLLPGESLDQATARLEERRKLEREVAALQKKITSEPQLNRKVELRRQLRERADALTLIAGTTMSSTETP